MARAKTPRKKHVPIRTCVACRQTDSKRTLVRIVRTATSGVQVDPTGKMAGRGAYLCRNRACWDAVLGSSQQVARLNAALKTTLTEEEKAALRQFADSLPEAAPSAA